MPVKMAALKEFSHSFVEIFILLFGIGGCVLIKMDHNAPKPYMDEIFHVPQAQKYCEGRFSEWDPMITTLPGLYLSSVGVAKPLSWLFGIPMKLACSTFWLRSINVAFSVGNFVLLLLISRKLHNKSKGYDPSRSILNAVTLAATPVLYFFTFLYYTDPGSTFFSLLMYFLSLCSCQLGAALSGVAAIMFRQTNIVWVVFVAGKIVADHLIEYVKPEKKDFDSDIVQNLEFVPIVFSQLLKDTKGNMKRIGWLITGIIKSTFCYIAVGVGFAVFIVLNGGIVVGAKDDHQAGLHFPQLFYFLAFTGAFSWMHFLSFSKVIAFLKFLVKRPLIVLLFTLLSALIIWKFTFAHRYLLADNRHYTFYIWAKIFRRHELIKYAAIPCYLFAFWSIQRSLQHCNILWKLGFMLCIAVNLVPSMLMEFRYFIMPYLFLRLHMKIPSYTKLILELIFYVAVNAVTIYIFLNKPFKWEGQEEWQRFMW